MVKPLISSAALFLIIMTGATHSYAQHAHGHYPDDDIFIPDDIEFGGWSHVDYLAKQLEKMCKDFCWDLHYNYRHNHDFAVTYAEAYRLWQVAKFIHAAHGVGERESMRSKLRGMDTLFHHVQEDVRHWTRVHVRQVGRLGIVDKMERIEEVLHHLMRDMGVNAGSSADPYDDANDPPKP